MAHFQFEYPRAYHDAWSHLSGKGYGMESHGEQMWIHVCGQLKFEDQMVIDRLLREEQKQREAEARYR